MDLSRAQISLSPTQISYFVIGLSGHIPIFIIRDKLTILLKRRSIWAHARSRDRDLWLGNAGYGPDIICINHNLRYCGVKYPSQNAAERVYYKRWQARKLLLNMSDQKTAPVGEAAGDHFPHFATLALHVGQEPEQWSSLALVPPITLSSTFKQKVPGKPVSKEERERERGGDGEGEEGGTGKEGERQVDRVGAIQSMSHEPHSYRSLLVKAKLFASTIIVF